VATGRLFVITGPSGVGKGTLIRRLRERMPGLELSVSATTRPPRPGEVNGVDYHFTSDEEFDRLAREGRLLEHATYSGHRYGTPRSEVEPRLAEGRSVVLEIEVQGARQVRRAMPEAIQVFIAPPSPEALRERLQGRGTDRPEEIERRLAVAEEELAARREFGHVVVNDELDRATDELVELVREIAPDADVVPEADRG
jgi:guanylate kinase